MEEWKRVWREGVAPLLSDDSLTALRLGLERNDPTLIQGQTTIPPPLACVQDWPVEAACAIGYCAWKGEGRKTVAEAEEFFAALCFQIDQRICEPAGCRWWLNFWDESPREVVFREMLAEVERETARRAETRSAAVAG